jgi:hypothetical protein
MIVVGLAALAAADRAVPTHLAANFERYSRALQASDVPVSSVERFLFSLILAHTQAGGSAETM